MESTVLIVEDETDLARLIAFNLQHAGCECVCVECGVDAIRQARRVRPSLVVLDLMLPDMRGTEVLRQLQQDPLTVHIPVIIVSALDSEIDRVVGFELGAQDYVTKPFSPRELTLRVTRILRKRTSRSQHLLQMGAIEMDLDAWRASVDGHEVHLAPVEFSLLRYLMEKQGQVCTRDELLAEVWGDDCDLFDRTVDVHIARLRRKLQQHGNLIHTVRGEGYRVRNSHTRYELQ